MINENDLITERQKKEYELWVRRRKLAKLFAQIEPLSPARTAALRDLYTYRIIDIEPYKQIMNDSFYYGHRFYQYRKALRWLKLYMQYLQEEGGLLWIKYHRIQEVRLHLDQCHRISILHDCKPQV